MHVNNALLLSGGVESTCLAWWIRPSFAYTVDYGQVVAEAEIRAAKNICHHLGIKHRILSAKIEFVRPGLLGGETQDGSINNQEYWQFRNQFLITCAGMQAEQDFIEYIIIGSVANDTKFIDGSSMFFKIINKLIKLQNKKLSIIAPGIRLTTSELIKKCNPPRSVLGYVFSCHTSNIPCGECPGCRKNREVLSFMYDI